MKLHCVIRKEGELFVAKILENSVSSFWKTEKEALTHLQEAVELYMEDEQGQQAIPEIVSPYLTTLNYA